MAVDIRNITDRRGWNDLVLTFPDPDVRQSYEWGEVHRTSGWQPLRLAAFDDARCVVALAVRVRHIAGLGAIAYAPRAPLIRATEPGGDSALPRLIDAVARRTAAVFLRVSPAKPDDGSVDHLRRAGFRPLPDLWSVWNTPRNIMVLPLHGSEEDVLGRMARRRRQYVHAAIRHGDRPVVGSSLADVRNFYRMLVEHGRTAGYPVRDWLHFEALHREFAPQGALLVLNGVIDGRAVCGMLGIRDGGRAYALHAPTTPAARGTRAGDIVDWQWIRWAREAGCREIDYGTTGTSIPPRETHPGYGIYRFKLDLGCESVLYSGWHDYVLAPLRYRVFRHAEVRALPALRRWRARPPLRSTTRAMPPARRAAA